jgi:hypothetical protein
MEPLRKDEHAMWLDALKPGDEVYADSTYPYGGIIVRRVARLTNTQIILEPFNEMATPERFNRRTGWEVGDNKRMLKPVTEAVRATIAAQILCRRAHEAGKWLARLTAARVEDMPLEVQQRLMRVIGGVRVLSKEGVSHDGLEG